MDGKIVLGGIYFEWWMINLIIYSGCLMGMIDLLCVMLGMMMLCFGYYVNVVCVFVCGVEVVGWVKLIDCVLIDGNYSWMVLEDCLGGVINGNWFVCCLCYIVNGLVSYMLLLGLLGGVVVCWLGKSFDNVVNIMVLDDYMLVDLCVELFIF